MLETTHLKLLQSSIVYFLEVTMELRFLRASSSMVGMGNLLARWELGINPELAMELKLSMLFKGGIALEPFASKYHQHKSSQNITCIATKIGLQSVWANIPY